MIYLDTSVALAHLLAEDHRPTASLWGEQLVSSRLLQFEIWTRVNGLGMTASHGEAVRALISRVSFVEMTSTAMERALEPFPVPVRTLDAIHLASLDFLSRSGQRIRLASYDARLLRAARALRFEILDL